MTDLPDLKDYKFDPDKYYAIDWKVAGGEKDGPLVIPPKNILMECLRQS